MDFFAWAGAAPLAYQVLMGLGVIALVAIGLQFTGLDLMPELPEDAGFFTLRNVFAFCLGLSVAAVLARYAGKGNVYAIALGLLTGFMFLAFNLAALAAFTKLGEDGTVKLESLVGTTGQVTVPVAPGQGARGKANFSASDGRLFELPVYHPGGEALARGTLVRLTNIDNGALGAVTEVTNA